MFGKTTTIAFVGYYCDGEGKITVTAECSAGWYCTSCAYSDKPADPTSSSTVVIGEYPIFILSLSFMSLLPCHCMKT